MKKLILFLFFISTATFAQLIKGKVVDEQNQPLPGANIYFDGTTIATVADENGNFILNYASKLNTVLAISFIGYQTQFIETIEPNRELKIVLKESINSLKEVVIRKNRFNRKQMLQLFREQFLGRTPAGKMTIIENEDDITFDYDETNFTIKAYSEKPLLINNISLGYKITYELVTFEVRFYELSIISAAVSSSYYAGFSRFEEVNASPKIVKQREKSYQGSQVHFFRNLVNNIWGKKNFLLFKGSYQDNPNDYFAVSDYQDLKKVSVTKQEKGLSNKRFVAEFNLLFDKKEQSKITFETEVFYVDKFGNNSNMENIFFSGAMSQKKVGDMLPIDFGM